MRLPDDNKRRLILDAAAKLFATQAYHKVRLDDVALAAGVGKGTLYVYFQSKEDLYFTLIYDGIALLLGGLKSQLAADHAGAMHRLRTIVEQFVTFAFQHPQFFELMKTYGVPAGGHWEAQRAEMYEIIEQTIRAGVSSGEFHDAHPALTARFIPGMVRSAMVFAGKELDPSVLIGQICALLESGLLGGRAR